MQGNVWAIHHNDRDFPSPDTFDPLRYYVPSPSPLARPFPNDRGYMTFGWGRRVCVGQALAEQGTFISIARLLWAFKFSPAIDAHSGREIPLDIFAYTNGLNMRPEPFRCSIEARSERIQEVLEREGKEARERLRRFDGESKFRLSTYGRKGYQKS